jgi:hypothetical protein
VSTTSARPDTLELLSADVQGPSHDPAVAEHCVEQYVGAVVHALGQRGVLACPPQRTGEAGGLTRSVLIDCTALRITTWENRGRRDPRASLGAVLQPGRARPVSIVWDERVGWSAELGRAPTARSVRYPHPDPFPAPGQIAEFVSDLAMADGHTPSSP